MWFGWVVAGLGLTAQAPGATEAGREVFKLREVSVFMESGSGFFQQFLRGQAASCQDSPFPEVKAYPKFASQKPIYGSICFGERPGRTGPALYYFALDESRGTGKGYDRLYLDLKRDLDLRNDPPVKPRRSPPEGAQLRYSSIKEQVIFEPVAVNLDFGPAGTRAVSVMPRLLREAYDGGMFNQVSFVRCGVYEGNIKVGGRSYRAWLGNDYLVTGRLDLPGTALLLTPRDGPGTAARWWGADRLMAARKVGDKFFVFSASPTGEELTVSPYQGELGTFAIGAGGRKLNQLTASGSLQAADRAVAVGNERGGGDLSLAGVSSCELPVGDYSPALLDIQFGRLRIQVSNNYHSDGKPRDLLREVVRGIAIRRQKPYVLDFSNPPAVVFASPAKDTRLKPGQTLEVKAVLVDPKLDMMIRGLDDTSRPQIKGRPFAGSLDPTVLITRANGEKVAEGVMPFG